jgi:hypothetical protein
MHVRYRYWNKLRNCGDAVTAYILRDVLGHEPVMVGPEGPHLLATGSIFFMANEHSVIWGSGILHPSDKQKAVDIANVRAVRGFHTLAALREHHPTMPDVPMGDPGVLVSRLLPQLDSRPRYRAAVVPHHRRADRIAAMGLADDVCVVDMRDDTLLPVEQIAQSDVVISQSLHGLVFAAALNKPYVWISETTEDSWTFKFNDWFSTTDNPQATPLDMDGSLEEWLGAAEHRPFKLDTDALIRAFPAEDVAEDDPAPVIDFETCRRTGVAVIRADWLGDLREAATSFVDRRRRERLFMESLHQKIAAALPRWSEIPYVLICPPAARYDGFDAELVARLFDRFRAVDGLVVLPTDQVDAFEPHRELSSDRIAVSRAAVFRPGAGLLLRPNGTPSFERNIGTIRMRSAAERQ